MDYEELVARCDRMVEEIGELAAARCGTIHFTDGSWFIEVNVIERASDVDAIGMGTQHVEEPESAANPEPMPQELVDLYTEQQALWFMAFREGKEIKERVESGVLQYDDSDLYRVAQALAEVGRRNKGKVILNLMRSADAQDRTISAGLLAWVGLTQHDLVHTLPAILDASLGVRNNYSRNLYLFSDLLTEKRALDRAVELLITQLRLPSHADRNKALHALKSIAERAPHVRTLLRNPVSLSLLQDIAARSSLPNVGGVAGEIIQLLSLD